MEFVPMSSRLDMPFLPAGHRLHAIIEKALSGRLDRDLRPIIEDQCYWPEEMFSLLDCGLYRSASAEKRHSIHRDCCVQLLEEAFYIEKAGLSYSAKMVLLSKSADERLLYSLFAADEAAHFHAIRCFAGSPAPPSGRPFLQFLEDFIDRGWRAPLIFIIQVILEGWGLSHYRLLADNCLDEALSAVLKKIVLDEARHYGSGVILAQQEQWTAADTQQIVQSMETFLHMVRSGPVGVVRVFERRLGALTRAQRLELFHELGAQGHAAARLQIIRSLMSDYGSVVEQLDSRGCFLELNSEDCVSWD
jgi:hypothetical protein